MKPTDLSSALRRIASKIEASKSPSRELVLKDLKSVVSKLASSESGHYDEYDDENSFMPTKMVRTMDSESATTRLDINRQGSSVGGDCDVHITIKDPALEDNQQLINFYQNTREVIKDLLVDSNGEDYGGAIRSMNYKGDLVDGIINAIKTSGKSGTSREYTFPIVFDYV